MHKSLLSRRKVKIRGARTCVFAFLKKILFTNIQASIYCLSDGMDEGGLLSMSHLAPLITHGNLQITIKIT